MNKYLSVRELTGMFDIKKNGLTGSEKKTVNRSNSEKENYKEAYLGQAQFGFMWMEICREQKFTS